MSQSVSLLDFPVGEIGEIVELVDNESLFEQFGASCGMSIVVLHKAVDWLVQIGYNQVHMGKEHLQRIKVKSASI